jgi:hypothetical protein
LCCPARAAKRAGVEERPGGEVDEELVACWGAKELMQRNFGLPVTVVTGPATDNEVGRDYVVAELGLPAHNARRDAEGLLRVVRESMDAWRAARPVLAVAAS